VRINIHLIGKTREDWLSKAEQEYLKRLGPLARISFVTHKAEVRQGNENITGLKLKEADTILKAIDQNELLVALDEAGQQFSSPEFSAQISSWMLAGNSKISFVVGGVDGLDESVIKRADLVLSMSRMTFTHQMVRMFLLEQIYRAFMIRENRPYHR
jgi:23S rRNA (pseudouridine1915-N3)-methyltransferase